MPLLAELTSGLTRSEILKGTGNNSMFGKRPDASQSQIEAMTVRARCVW